MFYVYCREFYDVWEPAEGGYYVTASQINDCGEFFSLEDAVYDLLDSFVEWGNSVEIERGSWKMGLITRHDWYDGTPETSLYLPWFYINDGLSRYEVGISADKPLDEPYLGYC